jgi:hypothetical protein
MPAKGEEEPTRGRSGGRAGSSGYDYQDLYLAQQLADLLAGDNERDPIVRVWWEKKVIGMDGSGSPELVYVDDAIVERRSGTRLFVQLKETAPGGSWSVKQFINAGVARQFWQQWQARLPEDRARTNLLLASGGDVGPVRDLVDAAQQSSSPAELLGRGSSLRVVADVRLLASELGVDAESGELLGFLQSIRAELLPDAAGLKRRIDQTLRAFGREAPTVTDRLLRLIADSKHPGGAVPSSYTRVALIDHLRADAGIDETLVAAGLIAAEATRGPDFSPYLRALVAELTNLPELPNRTKNLSLGDIIRISVTFPVVPEHGPPSAIDLPQAVAINRAWLLVGDGGEGKSTALRFLAHHFAAIWLAGSEARDADERRGPLCIPVYIALRPDRTSLRDQVRTAMERPGFTPSRDEIDAWLASQPFLLLLDRLEDTDARLVLEDLAELLRLAPNARLVVASRPLQQHAHSPWPVGRLQPPSDDGIRSFLKTLLGEAKGVELFDLLAVNRLLGPFRRPLFTRLLALSSPQLVAQGTFTPGEMLRDVLEGRFLGSWERPGSQVEVGLMRAILADIAAGMIDLGTFVMERDAALDRGVEVARRQGVTADMLAVEVLLNRALSHGLLIASGQELQFWHASFRDYFAAVWLECRASHAQVYLRGWLQRWHECLVLYFGLLRGERLGRELIRLLVGFRLVMRVVQFSTYPVIASRVIFILRCLVQAGDAHAEARRRFIRLLPDSLGYFYIGGVSVPVDYGLGKEQTDSHRYFCDLLGQFGTPEAFAYLQTVKTTVDIVAPGLLHDPQESVITRLVEFIAKDDGDGGTRHRRGLVSHLLLRSQSPRCVTGLQRALRDIDSHTRERVLACMCSAVNMYWGEEGTEPREWLTEQWTPTLVEYALRDDDDGVRSEAVCFLRALGYYEVELGSLPPAAHEAFLAALSDSSAEVREHAMDGLHVPALAKHMDIAWRMLDDPSVFVVYGALFHFRIDSKRQARFGRAILKVLRRIAADEGSQLRIVADQIHSILLTSHPERVRRRCVALLMSAAVASDHPGMRLYAVLGLGVLNLGWTAPFLTNVFRNDPWAQTRSAALDILRRLVGAEAGALVLEGLKDESSEVRFTAAAMCQMHDFGKTFPAKSGPLLFGLLSDSDHNVQNYAMWALQRYGYLAKDRYPSMPNPVYLGPPVADVNGGACATRGDGDGAAIPVA